MARKPLNLDWDQIMTEEEVKSPTLELEVVHIPPPSIPSTPETSLSQLELSSLTDHQLEERLQRQVKLIGSGFSTNLRDNGEKLHASIRLLKEELDKRKLIQLNESAKQCDSTIETRTAEDIGAPSTSLHATSKSDSPNFCSLFTSKLDKMAGFRSTSKNSSCDTSKMHERVNSCSISSRLSLRKTPFRPASKLTPTKKRRSINTNCNSINTSSFYSPCIGRRYSKRLKDSEELWGTLRSKKVDETKPEAQSRSGSGSKRSRAAEVHNLSEKRSRNEKMRALQDLIPNSNKVQNVVLLDEEDLQSKDLSLHASDDRKEVKIYYPSRDDPQSVELSYSDIKCLEPKQYISSPIMNFYIRYLQRPLPVNGPQNDYYFFNTYFYGKLEDSLLTSKCDKSLRFSKLRRWWKGVNIFEKAYIFLPIHKDLHWSLVIVSIPPKEDKSCAIILHLDSLGMHNSTDILYVIQCYLTEEWNSVKPASEKILIEKKKIMVPQQKNEYDCGLFVLYFMDRFIEEAPQRLVSEDLHMFGRKWFQPEEASGLRKRLKDLLLEEFESSRLECGREETHDSQSSPSKTDEELSIIQS